MGVIYKLLTNNIFYQAKLVDIHFIFE